METFSRINFWMVILCLCLPANSHPLNMKDSNINMMQNVTCVSSFRRHFHCRKSPAADIISCVQSKQEQDAKFYTPINIKVRTFRVQLSFSKPQGSLVQEASSGVVTFHTDVTDSVCFSLPPPHSQPDCLIAALQCFKVELQTVSSECKDPEEVINGTIQFLQNYIGVSVRDGKSMDSSESCFQANSPISRSRPPQKSNFTACPCEGWSEKPFPEFLENMETLIQLINSQAS